MCVEHMFNEGDAQRGYLTRGIIIPIEYFGRLLEM